MTICVSDWHEALLFLGAVVLAAGLFLTLWRNHERRMTRLLTQYATADANRTYSYAPRSDDSSHS